MVSRVGGSPAKMAFVKVILSLRIFLSLLQMFFSGFFSTPLFVTPFVILSLDSAPYPVLQYADDTIIFLKATPAGLHAVKNILRDFALATCLTINYHKTTFLPVGLDADEATNLASIMGAPVATFPQTYLGLPLSPHKISVSDCLPLIAACDKYLSG